MLSAVWRNTSEKKIRDLREVWLTQEYLAPHFFGETDRRKNLLFITEMILQVLSGTTLEANPCKRTAESSLAAQQEQLTSSSSVSPSFGEADFALKYSIII